MRTHPVLVWSLCSNESVRTTSSEKAPGPTSAVFLSAATRMWLRRFKSSKTEPSSTAQPMSACHAMERRAAAAKRERVSQTVRWSGCALEYGNDADAYAWADHRLRVMKCGFQGSQ